jgi:hypothetical protein
MRKTAKGFIEAIRDETGVEDGCPVCTGHLEDDECVDCGTNFADEAEIDY